MIIHGSYHWFPKTMAFRRDYCRNCEADSTSLLIRTLDVFHIFWIPLLPCGMWSRWFCSACGRRPHINTRTRKGYKIAGLVVLALMCLAFWFPGIQTEMELPVLWAFRLGLPVAMVALAVSLYRHGEQPHFKRRLAQVVPHTEPSCLLCGGILIIGTPSQCISCGVKHLPLKRPAASYSLSGRASIKARVAASKSASRRSSGSR